MDVMLKAGHFNIQVLSLEGHCGQDAAKESLATLEATLK
jgi:hypothetical protein